MKTLTASARPLVAVGSPTHSRRLVAVLHGRIGGFTHQGQHFTEARFSRGELQARNVSGERWSKISPVCYDSNGKEIVVSLVPPR